MEKKKVFFPSILDKKRVFKKGYNVIHYNTSATMQAGATKVQGLCGKRRMAEGEGSSMDKNSLHLNFQSFTTRAFYLVTTLMTFYLMVLHYLQVYSIKVMYTHKILKQYVGIASFLKQHSVMYPPHVGIASFLLIVSLKILLVKILPIVIILFVTVVVVLLMIIFSLLVTTIGLTNQK